MKYICLAYEDEKILNNLTAGEWHSLRDETVAYLTELQKKGHILAAEALQSINHATTVRMRGGKINLSDGPFAETKEQLGGFLLIEARDLNEAIQIASKWPSARFGSIEVRPIETEFRDEGRYEVLR
ncbi:MAG: YciI family protein [Leptospirales bacterium]|nr:YciI family protein [Leptospirales bacterium]